MSDQIIFEADGRLIGFDTAEVHKIMETDRLYFLPGQSGIVTGIVTLSGEPVTVLDTFALLSLKSEQRRDTEFHRIIVFKESDRLLGFDIGSIEISFLLEEGAQEGGAELAEVAIQGKTVKQIVPGERKIETIDWLSYFEIAAETLSTEQANG